MLGSPPPRRADEPQHTSLPNPKTIATATTEMMWAVALATTRVSLASTAHGLALWSRMLRSPISPWSLMTGSLMTGSLIGQPFAGGAAAGPTDPAPQTADTAAPAAAGEEGAAFASYRSSGGHAAAQVITHH